MNHTLRHAAPLVPPQRNRLGALDVDQEFAVEDEEELVLVVMLVPMELAVDHPKPYDCFVDRCERLVEPRRMCRGLRRNVDQLKVAEGLTVGKLDVPDPFVEVGEDRASLRLDDSQIDVFA